MQRTAENQPFKHSSYITGVQNISSVIQLLEQIAKEQYEIKALADNEVKVQLKTYEC
jgi:cell division protein FtsB